MRKTITRIVTHDTKAVYEFPTESAPQIWEVQLQIACVDKHSGMSGGLSSKTSVFLTRGTLEKHKLLPRSMNEKATKPEPTKTPEDLLLELLEMIGFYPTD